ncbi:MAG: ABC transporter permease [Gemmatimonadales bacterium]
MSIRSAIRSLRRSPGFTTVAIVSLAIGLGANTALFTLLNAVLLRPLPYPQIDRLVDVSEDNPAELCAGCAVGTTFPTFRDWRTVRAFDRFEAYQQTEVAVSGIGDPQRIGGALVTAGLLDLLGQLPERGRLLQPEDDEPGAPLVVVISHRLWTNTFGGDTNVIGRTVRLDGEGATIVGIARRGFGFPEFAELWIPLRSRLATQARDDRSLGVVGRLAPGVSPGVAEAELAIRSAAIAAAEPATNAGWVPRVLPLERPLADSGLDRGLVVALAASAFVLLIACANLANLLLARGTVRTRETAVRLALGAGRGIIVGELVAESLVIALTGGLAGLFLAVWIIQGAAALIGGQLPAWLDLGFDWRVFGFSLGAATAAGLLFGLLPAFRAARTDVQTVLKGTTLATTGSRGDGRLRDSLAVVQIALAVILLAGTGTLLYSMARWQRMERGYDPNAVLTGSLALAETRYTRPEAVGQFGLDLVDRLAAMPGMLGAAVEHQEFLGTFVGTASRVTLEGAAEPLPNAVGPRFGFAVTPAYFRIRGIALEEGRLIDDRDRPGEEAVVVVNRTTADRLWPGRSPLGSRLRIDGSPEPRWYTVVGVVRTPSSRPFDAQSGAFVYTAFRQEPARPLSVLVATAGPATIQAAALRAVARDLDPDQPIDDLMSLAQVERVSLAPLRGMLGVLASLGAIAIVLAAMGIYGVLAYLVARRTRELGIRMALGAAPRNLVRLVLGHGTRLSLLGIGLGVPAAVALTGVLRQALFGIVAVTPAVYLVTAGGVTLLALVACWWPARRAAVVNPVEALRAE